MIIQKPKKTGPVEIDLTGPEGNVYFLLKFASQFAKQLSLDGTKIQSEMMSGDYENAVNTFDSYFGDYVTLLR
jgi:hypothetical protein